MDDSPDSGGDTSDFPESGYDSPDTGDDPPDKPDSLYSRSGSPDSGSDSPDSPNSGCNSLYLAGNSLNSPPLSVTLPIILTLVGIIKGMIF